MLTPALFHGGRRAAVSLTYDDGIHEHLDNVIPDLNASLLRGTFFIPTARAASWPGRMDEWRLAVAAGHEIGNHTRHHPCSLKYKSLTPNFALEAYSIARMEAELVEASRELNEASDGPPPIRTYAYTCSEDFVGPEHTSYRPLVGRLFAAARGGSNQVVTDPMTVDLNFVPSVSVQLKHTARDLMARVDQAIESGGWCVFTFHGVGGGHGIDCDRSAHQALCRYIAERMDRLWCGTFLEVAQHLRQTTHRPWGHGG